jgi:ADP-ribosylglycohydrolase/fructose-1,6-bisphosphatase/inositol monophosphatase family enzyme
MHDAPALPTLLPEIVAAAEAGGSRIAAEFAREGGPRGADGHAPIDQEVEADLRRILLALLPASWRGEETGVAKMDGSRFCWLVDPNDGTSAFLRGHRGSAVSIALLRDGVPVLGVVHAPCSPDRGPDTIAWAEGLGHLTRNGVAVASDLRRGELAAGRIVFVSQGAADCPLENAALVAPGRFVALASIAYRLARVAAGDGVAALSLNAPCGWDYAGGHALLRGAGGDLLDERGQPVVYTPDGLSSTGRCFGGAPAAARELATRDWSRVGRARRLAPRVKLDWPRHGEDIALDRGVGCLLGQAIGDSLGSLVEFKTARDIAGRHPGGVRDLADGGVWNTIAGQPTDDTELALDLARTLARSPEWSADAVAQAYADWYRSPPFDIGTTTSQAMSAVVAADAQRGAAESMRRAANRYSQSNGALMRCAPIGIWARDADEASRVARADAALSHPNPVCAAASAAHAAAISTAIAGGDSGAMFAAADSAIGDDPDVRALRDVLAAARDRKGPAEYSAQMGWVLIAFQNAFCHLARGTSFEAALVETVGQGGDTDTNAAICGALLGAARGRGAIPARWTRVLLACRPHAGSGSRFPRPERYWPDDVPGLAEALLLRRMRVSLAARPGRRAGSVSDR